MSLIIQPPESSLFGRKIANLSGNVTFGANETKTLHTITPTLGRATSYTFFLRAVSTTNDGTNLPIFIGYAFTARVTAGGVVTLDGGTQWLSLRNGVLGGSSNIPTTSGSNILIRFTTSAGAAQVTRCDVYADEST